MPLRIRVKPVLHGDLGRLLGAVAAFEVGNVAATLLILRASDLLTPEHGTKTATTIALGLYTAYNVAATIASVPAPHRLDGAGPGRAADLCPPPIAAGAAAWLDGRGLGLALAARHEMSSRSLAAALERLLLAVA